MRGPASLSAPATLACVRVLSEFVLAGARAAGFPVDSLPRYDLALEEALSMSSGMRILRTARAK